MADVSDVDVEPSPDLTPSIQVEQLYKQANDAAKRGDLQLAHDKLREALAVDPSHEDVRTCFPVQV